MGKFRIILTSLLLLVIGGLATSPIIANNGMMEICDNGIDDDGDGLIDCFDNDCFGSIACEGFYYGNGMSGCTFEPETTPAFELEFVCQTDDSMYPIDQRSAVYVGDMDGDGIPEMVANDPNPGRIQIFNGVDCSIKQSIVVETNSPFAQVVIADVDKDGLGDMFMFENGNNLARFEYGTATAIWRTADGIEVNNYSTPHVADFNADGIPEIYAGDHIYNSIDGTRLAMGIGSRGNYNNNSDSKVIAYDVFQVGDPRPGGGGVFGSEANGLELIAGNNVYTVELGNGTMDNGTLTVVSKITANGLTDGFTSIADIDGDCEIDVIVMDAGKIYVWNPRTQTQIGTSYSIASTSGGGRINIGDFDGDGMVEMGTAGANRYVVIEYVAATNTLVQKWQKTGLDDGSQRTGSSLFDFEGDGTKEVIYSEEGHLFILNAATGAEIIRVPAEAGTRTEYPLVADVNADGAAEIIVTAQDGNGPGFSGNDYVQVYRSKNFPWVSARPVWNQHGFFNTNINDDLTVPIVQQDMLQKDLAGAFNSFLAQSTILSTSNTPAFAAADATLNLINIGLTSCPDILEIELKVENIGDAPIPAGTPIAFYDSNPTLVAANLLGTTTVPITIEPDSMDTFSSNLNISPLLTPIDIYGVVNDTGFVATSLPYDLETDFPVTGTAECDFTNNLDSALSIICVEMCGDDKDNDGDGLVDEPNIMASDTTGCSGAMLAQMTTDLSGGTWGVISSIGTTIDNSGNVTLGINNSSTPDVDTVFYVLPPCNDTLLITTFDNLPPALTCPGNRSLLVDASCKAALGDYTSFATVTDNCTAANMILLTQTPAVGTTLTIGTTTVTIDATDLAENKSTCSFQVTVSDNINPSVTCPTNSTVQVEDDCEFSIPDYTKETIVSDNCTIATAISQTQMPTVGTIISGHGFVQTITINALDEAGNAAQCSFQITLQDTIAPTLVCPADQVLSVNNNCNVILPDYRSGLMLSDNCSSLGNITVTQTLPPGTTLTGQGSTHTITITATDENTNTAQCTFEVKLEDLIPPVSACPPNQNVTADENCKATIPDYTGRVLVVDNCSPANLITINQNPIAGTTISGATTQEVITLTASDENGNSTSCNFTITLQDLLPPTISCIVNDTLMVNAFCQAVVPDYSMSVTLADNCASAGSISINQNPIAGLLVSGHGTTQNVMITAMDKSGNTSQCTTAIYVRDTLPPLLICPDNEVVSVDAMCQIILADYTIVATTDDNCVPDASITLTQDPPVGTILMGDGTIQTVTITGNDGNGNSSTCQFIVELDDDIDPSITCPSNQNLQVADNCEALIPDYTSAAIVISNCLPATDFIVTQDPPSGTLLSTLGTIQTITLTADNGAGKSNSCSFDIRLTDTIVPMLSCPADITVLTNAACEVILLDYTGLVTTTDNCSASSAIAITQNPSPATILQGMMTQTILIIATDESNNQVQCSFEVTTEDGMPPSLTCPSNDSLYVDGICEVLLPDYTSTASVMDRCTDAGDLSITQSPVSGTQMIGVSTQMVTLTASDGTDSSTCSFLVTILDTLPPMITCPSNEDIVANQMCVATVPDYTDAVIDRDNCTLPNSLTITQSPLPGTQLGSINAIQTITLTAMDGSGNQEKCTFFIQVIDDTPPTLTCPEDQVILINGCEYIIPDFSTDIILSDNCSVNSNIVIIQAPLPNTIIADTGVQEISLVAIDVNGNSSQCSFFIELEFLLPTTPTVFGN